MHRMVGCVAALALGLAFGIGRAASAQATATIQATAHVVDAKPSARAVSIGLRMTPQPATAPVHRTRRDIPGATIFLDTLRTVSADTPQRRITIIHW